jgi:hypothetical protein
MSRSTARRRRQAKDRPPSQATTTIRHPPSAGVRGATTKIGIVVFLAPHRCYDSAKHKEAPPQAGSTPPAAPVCRCSVDSRRRYLGFRAESQLGSPAPFNQLATSKQPTQPAERRTSRSALAVYKANGKWAIIHWTMDNGQWTMDNVLCTASRTMGKCATWLMADADGLLSRSP